MQEKDEMKEPCFCVCGRLFDRAVRAICLVCDVKKHENSGLKDYWNYTYYDSGRDR